MLIFKLKIMENIRILSFYLCLTFLDVAHPLLITGQEGEPTFLEGRSHGYHGKVNHFYYNLTLIGPNHSHIISIDSEAPILHTYT